MARFVIEITQKFQKALNDVSPNTCVLKAMKVQGDRLVVRDREYTLNRNVRIVAAGKAAVQMAAGAEEALGPHFCDGIASIPTESRVPGYLKTKCYEAAKNNLPDEMSLKNTAKILEFLDERSSPRYHSIIIFLISGGASALLCAPVNGISLDEKLRVIHLLAAKGANIVELNTVRIVLSKVKGGKLLEKSARSQVCCLESFADGSEFEMISLVMSDIVGGNVEMVGSGPTVPHELDPLKAKQILVKYGVWDQISLSVRAVVERVTPSDPGRLSILNAMICDNRALVNAMKLALETDGIRTFLINSQLEGDAREVGELMGYQLLQWVQGNWAISPPFSQLDHLPTTSPKRFAWLYGGETTVTFPANLCTANVKGGRNQELVLAAFNLMRKGVANLRPLSSNRFYMASLASDGQDGPTDATGAAFCSDDLDCTDQILSEMDNYLNQKDSYTFWSRFLRGRRLVKLGKTGNNLMDILVVVFEQT